MDPTHIHIILVAYNFPPDPIVGGARPFRFYRYLRELGYSCTVVTASRQPPVGAPGVEWVPDPLMETWERGERPPLSIRGVIERLLRRFVLPGAVGLTWSWDVSRRCCRLARQDPQRTPVVFATFPPTAILTAGLQIAWRGGLPWIADMRDPVPGALGGSSATSLKPYFRSVFAWIEERSFRTASAVVANTDEAGAVLCKRFPWLTPKLRVIWNGFDPEDMPRARNIPPRQEKILVHAGELYEGRNPNLILRSLLRLRAAGHSEAMRTRIVLVGPTANPSYIERALLQAGTAEDWLEIGPLLPKADAARLNGEADGLLLLQPHSAIQVPAKLFEYIVIGRPILAYVPPASAVERILSRAGVPYRCVYSASSDADADRIVLEFLQLDSKPVGFSRWFDENFNGRNQASALARLIQQIAEQQL